LSASHRILSYLRYWLYAVNEHSLHAPFVYDLYKKVFKDDLRKFDEVNEIRENFKKSISSIEITDYGAGSSYTKTKRRSISDIASKGVIDEKFGSLLYKLVKYTEAKNIVELGTSLGISTLYLSKASGTVINTFEGSDKLLDIADSVFEGLGISNIITHLGNIDNTLPKYLIDTKEVDFAFIDANHTKAATLNYFNQLAQKAHDKSCFVFDDIHWSKQMTEAWVEIAKDYRVTLSIDIYQFGIIFFNPEIRKQHYMLSY